VAALAVEHLHKRYGGVHALRDVSLEVEQGEVLALLGKNGAGKSTLVKVLCGAVQPDSGVIWIGGRASRIPSPPDAFRRGVVTVHQEPHVVSGLSVADNIMLGRWGRAGLVRREMVRDTARAALERLGSPLDLRRPAGELSIAEWQIIEIARALTQDVRVLIMDEPTSALGPEDAHVLVSIVRSLASDGVAVIYVSHRLDEIPRVADRITVLREGEVVDTVRAVDTPAAKVIELMVGRAWVEAEVSDETPEPAGDVGPLALRVRGLRVPGRVHGVDLDVREGEVVGLAGLVGAGRSELLRAVYGAIPSTGEVRIGSSSIERRSPRRMRQAGVALLTDDRKREGLFPELSLADNIALGNLASVSRFGWISNRERSTAARAAMQSLAIRATGDDQSVGGLSGGNQQKVVIARCLAAGVRVLLLDEPTRGVDVEAKFQIYELLRTLAGEGLAVVVAPSEFDELSHMCDRVVVLREGHVVDEFGGARLDVARVMAAAMEGIHETERVV
jgi:ABC-type sugar transport system ATPase subunit